MPADLHPLLELLISALLLLGAVLVFIGSLGMVRLADFYSRLHGPSKSTTLGLGGMLIASAVYFSVRGGAASLHEVLITFFLFITAPISAHLLAKAALHLRLPNVSGAPAAPARPLPGDAPSVQARAATSERLPADAPAAQAEADAPMRPPAPDEEREPR